MSLARGPTKFKVIAVALHPRLAHRWQMAQHWKILRHLANGRTCAEAIPVNTDNCIFKIRSAC
eukprot:1155323-Pelagomonas_calceolata.AAC.5